MPHPTAELPIFTTLFLTNKEIGIAIIIYDNVLGGKDVSGKSRKCYTSDVFLYLLR